MTTKETMRMDTRIASVCLTKPIWKARSVSVRVSASEFRKTASIAWLTWACEGERWRSVSSR